jgi:gamma-glutamyl:cysteine ligase YbdK (ATP-grasp superfamily)
MNPPPPYPLFSAYGIELEYAIVACDGLDVLPIADRYLAQAAAGEEAPALLDWSNEIVEHVIEVKNPRPQALALLPTAFQEAVRTMNRRLRASAAQLMPSAMHPWMRPAAETQLWSHGQTEIYEAFDRIFDCHRHGWSNLQSMHINLPFASAAEFAQLHAALRLALPILPALAASSPVADGAVTGFADTRMEVYRSNSSAIPEITGAVIPEPVTGPADYRARILQPMYRAIAPFDPDRILRHEWLNARGAIARFERNAIEVRVVDMQECPQADIAIAAAVVALTKALYRRLADTGAAFATARLARVLQACVRDAERAVVDDAGYLALWDFPAARCTAGELWQHLIETLPAGELGAAERHALDVMLRHGPLARRILRALDGDTGRPRLRAVYQDLCDCLQDGRQFLN